MVNEADDAQDTVTWLRTQPWFDGRLATLGGSYMGWVQWALLLDPPPKLRTAVVLVGPHDMNQAVYGTGAFNPAASAGEMQRLELRLDPCAHRLEAGDRSHRASPPRRGLPRRAARLSAGPGSGPEEPVADLRGIRASP